MIALLDYFLLMACVFLWHFYGEQDLNSINKPIASIFMKLSEYFFILTISVFQTNQKKVTCRAEQQNKTKQGKIILPEQLFLSKRGLNKFWLHLTAVLWWFEHF